MLFAMDVAAEAARRKAEDAAFMPDIARAYDYKDAGDAFLLPEKNLLGLYHCKYRKQK